MDKQLSPLKDHTPFFYRPGKHSRDTVIGIDQLAEEAYAKDFGKRPVTVHLIKRDIQTTGYFVIQNAFLPYIYRYPDNVSYFYTVNLETRTAVLNGVLTHKDILAKLVQGPLGLGLVHEPLN